MEEALLKKTPRRHASGGDDGLSGVTPSSIGKLDSGDARLVNMEPRQSVELDQKAMKVHGASGTTSVAVPRLAVSAGKWYFEAEWTSTNGTGMVGMASA